MIKVVLLTEKQAEELRGLQYADSSYFNPIEDADDNWVISVEEQTQCEIAWVKELPLINFKPKENERD
jgi:hypothetical protein